MHWLEQPFTKDKFLLCYCLSPSDKSLGPIGFNNEFMKNCGKVLQNDYYDLFRHSIKVIFV
jgi:hypothetical protein